MQVGPFHYIQSSRDSVGVLFDHATDPLEVRNLVWTHEHDGIVRQLRDSLAAATHGRNDGKGGDHDE